MFVSGDVQALLTAHHVEVAELLVNRSNLSKAPVDRVRRTRELLHDLHFGDPDRAEFAARRLWDIHSRITAHDDRAPVRATDPDLLGVTLVVGLLASATWYTLMTGFGGRHHVRDRADGMFAAMWPDVGTYRAAVGIPSGHVPEDADAAVTWAMDLLDRNWTDDEEARRVAGVAIGLTEGYVADRFPAHWQHALAVPVSGIEHAVAATAALTLRGPLEERERTVTGGLSIEEGLLACHTIRAALAVLPDSAVTALADTPARD